MGNKPIVYVTYENESISIKKQLTLHKSLYFQCYATTPMFADAHISSLGYLCFSLTHLLETY